VSRKTRARNPSHLGSKIQVPATGNSSTRFASIGGIGGFTGRCTPHVITSAAILGCREAIGIVGPQTFPMTRLQDNLAARDWASRTAGGRHGHAAQWQCHPELVLCGAKRNPNRFTKTPRQFPIDRRSHTGRYWQTPETRRGDESAGFVRRFRNSTMEDQHQ